MSEGASDASGDDGVVSSASVSSESGAAMDGEGAGEIAAGDSLSGGESGNNSGEADAAADEGAVYVLDDSGSTGVCASDGAEASG